MRRILTNLQEVLLGTKLFILFPAVPLAVVAHRYDCPRAWVFALSLLGLTPLAERISFLTEQIAFHTGPTVGGLMNATCGNATEMIIAILAVGQRKMRIVKLSLLGSILSNLLFVLGTSLFLGGISNLRKHQSFDPVRYCLLSINIQDICIISYRLTTTYNKKIKMCIDHLIMCVILQEQRQGDMNSMLLYLALLCQTLPMIMRFTMEAEEYDGSDVVVLSRASSFVMLIAYLAFLIFHLFSSHLSPPPPPLPQREDVHDDDVSDKEEEGAVIGMWSAIFWLIIMTLLVALLSDYLVSTIQDAADSWGLSVGFIGIILLPIVGNAAEHAGAVIFAFRNKLDITLGIALGSATQIALFVVPVTVLVAWTMGIEMDLNFNLLETACFALSILVTSLVLQDGTSNYMKGLVLLLCYVVIAACFFVSNSPSTETNTTNHTITKR
jgi:Ca2+:H+ antiporter